MAKLKKIYFQKNSTVGFAETVNCNCNTVIVITVTVITAMPGPVVNQSSPTRPVSALQISWHTARAKPSLRMRWLKSLNRRHGAGDGLFP